MKTKGIPLILVIFLIILLAGGGWFIYDKFYASDDKIEDNSVEKQEIVKTLGNISTVEEALELDAIDENVELKTSDDKTITIPAGFKVVGNTINSEEGIVIEDKKGNQFVWVPVDNIVDYARKDFDTTETVYNICLEEMPQDEYNSVNKYKGYYIGRFEAGDKEATEAKEFRDQQIIDHEVTIKSGQVPYNWINKSTAKELSAKVSENYKGNTFTKLCSSYAWDTALNFIGDIYNNKDTMLAIKENYLNSEHFPYKSLSGVDTVKLRGISAGIIPTGQGDSAKNIFDMGGNVLEWTSEITSNLAIPNVCRGGYYDSKELVPGNRMGRGNLPHLYFGFRVALYL